jgi:hypothetical protein
LSSDTVQGVYCFTGDLATAITTGTHRRGSVGAAATRTVSVTVALDDIGELGLEAAEVGVVRGGADVCNRLLRGSLVSRLSENVPATV